MPQVTSLYWWEGQIQQDCEVLLVAKTTLEHSPELIRVVPELHPYDVPELLIVPVEAGLPAYLKWVAESTGLSAKEGG